MLFINRDLKEFNSEDLFVITDFDKTLTSNSSESSIGVFTKFFPEDYAIARNTILELENSVLCSNLDTCEKRKQYNQIWLMKLKLLSKFLKDEKVIKDIAYSKLFIMREDSVEVLNYLSKKYRVIINSSGCGNLIRELLAVNGCNMKTITIFSNNFDMVFNNEFDETNIISSVVKTNENYVKLTKDIRNCLILGDTIEDLSMSPINSKITSVGFLDSNYDEYLTEFNRSFDIVATENEPYSSPIKFLKL